MLIPFDKETFSNGTVFNAIHLPLLSVYVWETVHHRHLVELFIGKRIKSHGKTKIAAHKKIDFSDSCIPALHIGCAYGLYFVRLRFYTEKYEEDLRF